MKRVIKREPTFKNKSQQIFNIESQQTHESQQMHQSQQIHESQQAHQSQQTHQPQQTHVPQIHRNELQLKK